MTTNKAKANDKIIYKFSYSKDTSLSPNPLPTPLVQNVYLAPSPFYALSCPLHTKVDLFLANISTYISVWAPATAHFSIQTPRGRPGPRPGLIPSRGSIALPSMATD